MDNPVQMEKIFQAVSACASVRRPLPARIDELAMKRDERRFNQLLKQMDGDDSPEVQGVTDFLLNLQRVFFNRGLTQITSASMVDLITVGLVASSMAQEELQLMTGMGGYLLHVLVEQRVISETDGDMRFLEAIKRVRPDLTQTLSFADEIPDVGDNYFPEMVREGFFNNSPVILWDEERTPFFVQPDAEVDFNQFIEQVAAKHSPLQLLAAYRLFQGDDYAYQRILTADHPRIGEPKTEHSMRFNLILTWTWLDTLQPQAILAELRVYRQFLRFCQDRGVLTARKYATLMKLGNQAAMVQLQPEESWSSVSEQAGIALADKVFTNPNYTMNSAAMEAALRKLDYHPKAVYRRPSTHPLALAKALDQHQLDLELKRATHNLDQINGEVLADDNGDLSQYREFVLDLHRTMVQTYHRRLNRWTKESLQAALCTQFQAHPWTATRPTLLRYLQVYFYYLIDQGAIKNPDAMLDTLFDSVTDYLTISENHLATD